MSYFLDNTVKQLKDWNFKTRTNKKDFWSFILVLFIVNILSSIVLSKISTTLDSLIKIAVSLISIPIAVRRCHDINKTAWAYFVPQIIILAMIAIAIISGGAAVMGILSGGSLSAISAGGIITGLGIMLLMIPVMIGIFIYYIIIFVKDSYPKENQWGPIPTTKEAESIVKNQTETKE